MSFADRNKPYSAPGLREAEMDPDPIRQFQRWFDAAVAADLPEPHAMTLATATPEGRPAARMVLLRGVDARGFVFYTNYDGRKGGELAANPWAALVFYLAALERQVRVEGRGRAGYAAESDAYFAGRPLGSQLGAWASAQSRVIPNREVLEQRVADLTAQYADWRRAPPAVLGRLSRHAPEHRVLAGPPQPPPRPPALPPPARRYVAARAPLALI